jgi:protein-S-isoprenylcysteine O-methyltransferase Ste14
VETIILIQIAYLALFGMLHSLLASLPFKRLAWRIFGSGVDRWYLPAFSAIASVTIMPLVLLLLLFPGQTLYIVPSPWLWLMVCGQALATLGTASAFVHAPHRFSISAQLSSPRTIHSRQLGIRGIYCWIRDPFLFFGLITIWLTPFMTVNLLITYLATSAYLYLGSLHWEKRLMAQFGEEYRDYQKIVPRMIRWKGSSYCQLCRSDD